jgi:hypothetical protein
VATFTLFTACGARGAKVTRYFESSAREKPCGNAGLSVEGDTRVDGSEWSGNAPLDHRFDTRLHFRSSAPFFDELDWRVWRSPDGQSGRILKFGFYQKLRDTDPNIATPLTFCRQATVEPGVLTPDLT